MSEASTPRLSATILLLRDEPDLQVLMVKRHYEIDLYVCMVFVCLYVCIHRDSLLVPFSDPQLCSKDTFVCVHEPG